MSSVPTTAGTPAPPILKSTAAQRALSIERWQSSGVRVTEHLKFFLIIDKSLVSIDTKLSTRTILYMSIQTTLVHQNQSDNREAVALSLSILDYRTYRYDAVHTHRLIRVID